MRGYERCYSARARCDVESVGDAGVGLVAASYTNAWVAPRTAPAFSPPVPARLAHSGSILIAVAVLVATTSARVDARLSNFRDFLICLPAVYPSAVFAIITAGHAYARRAIAATTCAGAARPACGYC